MKTVLFIEDESAMQNALGAALEKEEFTVLQSLNGEDGLRLAKSEHPDIILLDLILPKKDGFEVLKELKANEETKDIPVIILTNLEGSKDVDKALELGATTYLIKASYELADVIKKIRETLQDKN
jgi:DNA-binding response OmpR family regulator